MNLFKRVSAAVRKAAQSIARVFNRKEREQEEKRREQFKQDQELDNTKAYAKRAVEEWNRQREEERAREEEEKRRRMEEEEEEKRRDEEEREEDKANGYKTFEERFGTGWDQNEYNKFFDTFGGTDYFEIFGSETLIYIFDYARDYNIDAATFKDKVEQTVSESTGQGWTQQHAADQLFNNVQSYIRSQGVKL